MIARASVVAVAVLVATGPSLAQDAAEDVRGRVPLIDSVFASGAEERGAGLVIGVRSGSVLIATAAHVVRDPQDAAATSLQISFPWDQTKYGEATLIERDMELDIALIRLDAQRVAEALAELPVLCYRDPVVDERIATIGHRLDETWTIGRGDQVLTDKLAGDTRRFTVSPRGIAPGNSGGPVLGEDGCFLGVVTTRDATEARVTGAKQTLALVGGGLAANLMGTGSGVDAKLRRETFDLVGKALNQYMFDLEALPLTFKRSKLEGEQLRRLVEAYNTSYGALYNGRTGIAARLEEQFGRRRGVEYSALVTQIDKVHQSSVYIKLNDALAVLRNGKRLSDRQYQELVTALTELDRDIPPLRRSIDEYLSRLQPLVRNLIGGV